MIAHACIEATVRYAAELGYEVTLVKDAIGSFEKAVELNPSSSYAQNNLGLALIYDGQYEDAIDALEEATQLEPV